VKNKNPKQQRSSVSAEVFGAFNKKEDFKPRVIPKSAATKKNIESRLNQAFMFKVLSLFIFILGP
jgi:cAMP-dependent protein kinase regulator